MIWMTWNPCTYQLLKCGRNREGARSGANKEQALGTREFEMSLTCLRASQLDVGNCIREQVWDLNNVTNCQSKTARRLTTLSGEIS